MSKPAITLTQAAIKRVQHVLRTAPEGTLSLRVSVTQKGCSGLMYKIDYIKEIDDKDIVVSQENVTIYLDPAASLYLIGSTMDYVSDELSAKFVFNNPNAKESCGCGESFTV
jgi:iron-sulfur cluster assembly protein